MQLQHSKGVHMASCSASHINTRTRAYAMRFDFAVRSLMMSPQEKWPPHTNVNVECHGFDRGFCRHYSYVDVRRQRVCHGKDATGNPNCKVSPGKLLKVLVEWMSEEDWSHEASHFTDNGTVRVVEIARAPRFCTKTV